MPAKGDLTLDEVDHIFAQLPTMDAIRLTGGEPFVRRDLADIGRIAQERLKPLVMHVTTNGFLADRVVSYCEQRDRRVPLQMLVSIDGVGEKHNHVRGSTQAWNMVMETIRTLAPHQKQLGLRLGVNQTIVDADGVEHYRQLREVLRPFGVHNNVVMAYDMSATYNTEREIDVAPTEVGQFSTFGEFTDQNLQELLDEVEKDVRSLPFAERLAKRYYLHGIRNRLLKKRGTPNPKCVALNAHLRIFPNGDIPTCQFNSRVVGNLREHSFAEIWQNIVATEQRQWVKKCPGCWAECEVLPSAIYTFDLLSQSLAKAG
jgi:MoaA/NifB/PqqE/SkfB family radical SAM enzyme